MIKKLLIKKKQTDKVNPMKQEMDDDLAMPSKKNNRNNLHRQNNVRQTMSKCPGQLDIQISHLYSRDMT